MLYAKSWRDQLFIVSSGFSCHFSNIQLQITLSISKSVSSIFTDFVNMVTADLSMTSNYSPEVSFNLKNFGIWILLAFLSLCSISSCCCIRFIDRFMSIFWLCCRGRTQQSYLKLQIHPLKIIHFQYLPPYQHQLQILWLLIRIHSFTIWPHQDRPVSCQGTSSSDTFLIVEFWD